MANEGRLTKPWLVAAWPGMGHVAVSAGYYLMAKLGMHLLTEFPAQELFDVELRRGQRRDHPHQPPAQQPVLRLERPARPS